MENDKYYCQDCHCNIELKLKNDHEYSHLISDEINARGGMNAKIISCSEKQDSRSCIIWNQEVQTGERCIVVACFGGVIHLKYRKQVENNYENGSFCPHNYCRILFDDINDHFIKPNTHVNIKTENTCNIDTYIQYSESYEEEPPPYMLDSD